MNVDKVFRWKALSVGWQERRLKSKNLLNAIAFHLPAWITLLLIIVVPLAVAAYFSLSDMNLARAGLNFNFIGLQNYQSILVDSRFWFSFQITIIFIFATVGVELIAGTAIAVLLNTIEMGRRLFMSLIMIPMMLAPLVVGLTWTFLLNPQFGAATWLIQELNIPLPRAILSDLRYALPAIVFADVWEWTPFMILVVLSGLQTVPLSLLDAARVDGASYWQQVWYVMLPIIRPILIIGAFLRSVDAFRIFDIPYILTGGGPGSATEVIDLFTYRLAFKSWDMGKGMAVGIILFILNLLLSLILYRWMPQAESKK